MSRLRQVSIAKMKSSADLSILLVLADGSMLVSDDTAGAIYRISYAPK